VLLTDFAFLIFPSASLFLIETPDEVKMFFVTDVLHSIDLSRKRPDSNGTGSATGKSA
jgi:hypothetical protein